MRRFWFGEKKHLDAEKIQQKAKAKIDLRNMMDVRDETGYVAYIKALNPDLSKEELIRLIELFREQCEKR